MSHRIDVLGIFVALFMAATVAIGFGLLYQQETKASNDRAAYEDCVDNIPTYLDTQEIVYQEQECKR
jgi:hypothetical protein